jgi:DNA helicase-2/ATP-dependent DNA helicase PcrA
MDNSFMSKKKDDDYIRNLIDSLINKKHKPRKTHTDKAELFEQYDYEESDLPDKVSREIKHLKEISQSIEDKAVSASNVRIPDNLKIDYETELNPMQLLAVTIIDKPLLVIAGAGSGKTRTITYRVSYLIERGVPPEQILLLTFTRKASQQMINRTISLLDNNNAQNVMGGTFHSFANHMLRKYSRITGMNPNFTIIDTIDAQDTIDLIKKEMKLSKKDKAFPKKGTVYKVISASRNANLSIEDLVADNDNFEYLLDFIEEIELIKKGYTEYKKATNTLDYDDLLEQFRDLLRDNEVFRNRVQDAFSYIMIDEFQDTNIVQKEIVDIIAEKHHRVMVVGDDSQSIYSFRGANFENILLFPETYPECTVVKLEQNYRSQQAILSFTNSIIDHARIGYKKRLYSKIPEVSRPIVKRLYSQEDEASYIADNILEIREKDISLSEIAILYRASYHNNYIEMELIKRNIPYIVYGGIKFIERKHIKDIIAYLKIVFNPYDSVAWHRILKLISGIGDVSVKKILSKIDPEKGISFDDFKKNKYYNELKRLEDTLNSLMNDNMTIAEKLNMLKKYYYPILKNTMEDYKIRIKDVDVLIALASNYKDLERYLTDLALEPPSNKFMNETRPMTSDSDIDEKPLVLSTVHSAKGLEWNTVFILHLLEGLFPSARSIYNIKQLEEERRLFYVACTRAKERLYLTMPSYVSSYSAFFTKPSRFIAEIEKGRYDLSDVSTD